MSIHAENSTHLRAIARMNRGLRVLELDGLGSELAFGLPGATVHDVHPEGESSIALPFVQDGVPGIETETQY